MKSNTFSTLKNKGYLCGIGSGMTWGLDAVLLSVALGTAPFTENPVLVISGGIIAAALHDIFAAIWMVFIMGGKGKLKTLIPAIKSKDGMWCAIAAIFGGPLAMTLDVLAIAEGGPALAATVTACYPLLGTALAMVILKEKMSLRSWMGLFICVAGIIWIGYAPNEDPNIHIATGILLALGAAIGWALEGVVCGYGMKGDYVDPQIALLIRELTSAFVYLFIVIPVFLQSWGDIYISFCAIFTNNYSWILLGLTALIGMSSFFMWYTSIDCIGAAKALCLNVTYAFWSVVFTLLIFGGSFSVPTAAGSILVVIGVGIATLIKEKNEN